MAENLKPSDVSKVLQLALKVRESGDIKDPELKNAASRINKSHRNELILTIYNFFNLF